MTKGGKGGHAARKLAFLIGNTRHEASWYGGDLKLGLLVHVTTGDGEPAHFSSAETQDSVPHGVTGTDDGVAYLAREIELRPKDLVAMRTELDGLLSEGECEQAFVLLRRCVKPEHLYSTFHDSALRVVRTVYERLHLVRCLEEIDSRATSMFHSDLSHHAIGLCAYLLLTCFDILGQPAAWMDFGAWLRKTENRVPSASAQEAS